MPGMPEIGSEFFDESNLKAERFLGKVLASEVREGTVGGLAGKTVWYVEVENISRAMTFNYSKEILPNRGRNTPWTKLYDAYKSVGITLSNQSIPQIKGRYFWFLVSDLEQKQRDGSIKLVMRNFYWPSAIATDEEVATAMERRNSKSAVAATTPVAAPVQVPLNGGGDAMGILLSVIDGLNQEQLVEVASGLPELAPVLEDIKSRKLVAKLIADKKITTANGVYKVR